MLSHLKKQLILLCSLSTSAILTIVIGLVSYMTYSSSQQHKTELFNNCVNTVVDKIRSSNMINHYWLNNIEGENNLIIYIENNTIPLSYYGLLNPKTPRKLLIDEVQQLALTKDNINPQIKPITSGVKMSSTFDFSPSVFNSDNCYQDDMYYKGIEVLISSNDNFESIVIIQMLPNIDNDLLNRLFFFFILEISGCSMLFALSRLFITKAMKPVEENAQRQVEFVAAASHELRSPLAVIKLGISSLMEDINSGQNYIPHMESECYRMTRLISDMLFLATSDAKNWTLKKERIDLETFLIETYDLFCPITNSNNQDLILNLPYESLSDINADKERLRQVISILINNAMEYTPKNKSINISAYNNKKSVSIEIIDHGKGISDEQKKLIFNRFYRGDTSRTSKKHFGLGLNIAKEIIDLHHGKLTLKDTEGGGATFVIELLSL